MENKSKIDPKSFGIIEAYQKGVRMSDLISKFSHIKSSIYRWIMSSDTSSKDLPDDKETPTSLSNQDCAEKGVPYDGMTPEELLARYRQLLEQNRRRKVQLTLAETMIEVAEEEFRIAIRKKLVPSSLKS